MADLLDLLVDLPVLSGRAIDSLATGRYIGTGPYRIDEIGDDRVVMSANPGYHEAKRFRPDTLRWTGVSDPDNHRALADSDDTHIVTGLRAIDAKAIEETQSAVVLRSSTTVCATFMFNLLHGAGTSRALRRAINFSVDAEALVRDVAGGEATPITGPMTSRHLGYDPAVSGFPYDPDAARRELDGMKSYVPETITLDVPTVLPDEAMELAARIATYLEVIGLKVEIAVHSDRPGYAEMVKSKQIHDAACFDSSPASTYRLLREKFHSGFAGPWWLGYSNPDVDSAIDRAATTVDVNERRSLYQSIYRQLSDDAPWIYLYTPKRLASMEASLAKTAGRAGWAPGPGGILKFV